MDFEETQNFQKQGRGRFFYALHVPALNPPPYFIYILFLFSSSVISLGFFFFFLTSSLVSIIHLLLFLNENIIQKYYSFNYILI